MANRGQSEKLARWVQNPGSRLYRRETAKWYCHWCGERTRKEKNPAWDGETLIGPLDKMPVWLLRCLTCGEEYQEPDETECPTCGTPADFECHPDDSKTLIRFEDERPVYHEWSWMCRVMEWVEVHRCRNCRTVWKFDND